jgi:hypothetical protein
MKRLTPFLWATIGGLVVALIMPVILLAVQTYVIPSTSTGRQTEILTNAPNRDEALRSSFSGSSAPTSPSPLAGQLWMDTTNDQLKFRNAAASAWIQIPRLDQANTWTAGQKIALVANASCAAGLSDVRGWCMLTSGTPAANLRSIFANEASYTTAVINAAAKAVLLTTYVGIIQDGTAGIARAEACTLPGDSTETGCRGYVVNGSANVLCYNANQVCESFSEVIVRADSSGRIKMRCEADGDTTLGPPTCIWYVMGYQT